MYANEPILTWSVTAQPGRAWVLLNRTEDGPQITPITIGADHHWDTGAATEWVVYDGDTEIGRFASSPEASQFAEATYSLEDRNEQHQ